jgi:hypothetical protein
MELWIRRESSLLAGSGGGGGALSGSEGGAWGGDLGGRVGGVEGGDGCESDTTGFDCGTLCVRILEVRGGGGGGGLESLCVVVLRERGRGLVSFPSNVIFLWKTMLPLRLLRELSAVEGVCGDGGDSSTTSLSGVGFLAGDLGSGTGDVTDFSLSSLLGRCSGVVQSFSAGEATVCVHMHV